MRKIIIYPGRFHPFHKGHKGTYDYLVKKYGAQNVYIATTNKQDPTKSPFSFQEKKDMMVATGVPASQILEVVRTYNKDEYANRFDHDSILIFALSQKDAERLGSGKPKKDGSLPYILPLQRKLEPMDNHAYVDVAPIVNFDINGKQYHSATDLRNDYIASDDEGRMKMIAGLYGKANPHLKQIFDTALTLTEELYKLDEAILNLPLTESNNDIIQEYVRIRNEIKNLTNETI